MGTVFSRELLNKKYDIRFTNSNPDIWWEYWRLVTCCPNRRKISITWSSAKSQIFEMPTGGAAIMRTGQNLLYLARKEQCLALGTQLRTFKINDYKIYRVFPNEEVQFLHPADGVFPEKSNEGRVKVNTVNRSIGKNISPAQINSKDVLLKTKGVITG